MSSATQERAQKTFADLFPHASGGEVITAELAQELRELAERSAQVPTIAVLAARDVQQAFDTARTLQESSIKLTYPEDWVIYKTKDGVELAYLQDVGCQRVRPLWAITFDKVDLSKDFMLETLEDGTVFVEVAVSGRCALTGEENMEIGTRGSSGFFERAWSDSVDKPVMRAQAKANIRKAAIANGQGRLVRRFTGLGSVPKTRLVACGLDAARMRGTDFQSGTQGGSGNLASTPQIRMIAGESLRGGKVAGLDKLGLSFEQLEAKLAGAQISKANASKIIEKLKGTEKGGATLEAFETDIGIKLTAHEPGSEG